MGCTQSKIENEEVVSRCKDRKTHIKEAVASRNLFAAAHSAYSMALKNTGAALSDYGPGEFQDAGLSQPTDSQPIIDSFPPPPPPPSALPVSPLVRSASMPEIPMDKFEKKPAETIEEEDDMDEEDEIDDHSKPEEEPPELEPVTPTSLPPPPPPSHPRTSPFMPPSELQEPGGATWDYFFGSAMHESLTPTGEVPSEPHAQEEKNKYLEEKASVSDGAVNGAEGSRSKGISVDVEKTLEKEVLEPSAKLTKRPKQGSGSGSGRARASGGSVNASEGSKMVKPASESKLNILKILNELDDEFLKASESAHEVSKMLEANRMHYFSNFADNRGHIDHSARVMRVITWNRSFKNMPNPEDYKDDFDADECETHATILDKLLAWEKKLYDEVKAGEHMKIEYQKKVASLNKLKKHSSNPESLEKAKAAVSHLHTRYIVDMQSMDATVSEIQRLRDKQLFPKLVELVCGMAKMWEAMHTHHNMQLNCVKDLKFLDLSNALKETSEQHHDRTRQLCRILGEWHSQFDKLMVHQKEYIQFLYNWLKLSLIPIESTLKEKVSSPPRAPRPPIQSLLHAWHEQLEKLPVELAKGAISSFDAVMNTVLIQQEEELKRKDKCKEAEREYLRKLQAFESWHEKYQLKRLHASAVDDAEHERSETDPNTDEVIKEKKIVVETQKKRLDEEIEAYQKQCKHVREKSLQSLKSHLAELFRAMSEFTQNCSDTYKKLEGIAIANANETSRLSNGG